MIIEDENGQIWTREDFEEPLEGEPEPEEPIDLEEIETAWHTTVTDPSTDGAAFRTALILNAVPQLIIELRQARAELERLRAGERWEYTITRDGAVPGPDAPPMRVDTGRQLADGEQLWGRTVYATPWQPISTEPPF
ncbi:hypothetical protein [Thermoactinospora rubra]|uniref:hypothetical protein n=1 Tax=Thermoactinospora rubra TaxID=1088767 RepID=UPI000A10C70A|nr:hypothetical protein [Thermoactinospora rubra]